MRPSGPGNVACAAGAATPRNTASEVMRRRGRMPTMIDSGRPRDIRARPSAFGASPERSAAQVGEPREHAPAALRRLTQAELHEDAPYVALDRLRAEEVKLADPAVRVPFGH